MDSVSLATSVVTAKAGSVAFKRQVAVAANAAHTEKATVSALIDAVRESVSYGAGGQLHSGGAVGTRLSTSA